MKGGVYRMLTYNQEYPALIVTDQQFVDRLPLLGYGTNRAEDAQPLDMEAGVQVVEEGVLRVLLTGIGVGEHSFASFLSQVLAESGQFYLAVVIEVVRHVGGTGTGLVDGFVGRVEVEERFLSRVFFRLAVVPVQDDDALQQLVVEADQFLLQYPGAAARTEGYREPALAVDRIDAVIAGAHEENEKGGTGDVIRVLLVEYPSLFHEIVPSFRTFLQGVVFALDAGKQSDQFFRRVAYDAVDIHQALVRVIDHATDMRIGLSQSEERGAAPEKGFHIGFHFPDILRQ